MLKDVRIQDSQITEIEGEILAVIEASEESRDDLALVAGTEREVN